MHDPYVSTYLGNRFYLTRPHIDDVAIEDIAHGLAYERDHPSDTNSPLFGLCPTRAGR